MKHALDQCLIYGEDSEEDQLASRNQSAIPHYQWHCGLGTVRLPHLGHLNNWEKCC